MIRVTAASTLLLMATPALAADAAPAAPAPAPATAPATAPAMAPAASAAAPVEVTPTSPEMERLKRELLDEARREADERFDKAKDELRSEIRAELATQSAKGAWEEEWQEQKKKLDLLEFNGYLRVRPTLLYNMDLNRGLNADGQQIYPRPVNSTDPNKSVTYSWADTRVRFEPTLNLSEDIRLRTQIDALSNLILGSNPVIDSYTPIAALSDTQATPASSLIVRRVWGEVNTPVGLLSFGRMGNHWGLGLAHNDGNGLDSDYGDTVDRIMFTARLAGFYLIPMMDFVGKGPSVSVRGENLFTLGQPVDTSQQDDVTGPIAIPVLSFAVAKRDTDKELQQKLDKGEYSFNYGLYFSYRHQQLETVNSATTSSDPTSIENTPGSAQSSIARNATLYMPDVWARFVTKRLRLEVEVSGTFGTIGQRSLTNEGSNNPELNQSLSVAQVGAVLQGDYKLMDGNLSIGGEIGFASGDSAPGMGNRNILGNTPTQKGSIDGPQFNCSTLNCSDSSITNYRFNRDYRVDQILWREIMGGVTDALYFKPTVKYRIAEGFNVFMSVIYSRTIFAASAPGGDNNLGVEFDPGVSYVSEDGFGAQLIYGGLVPLKGLSNPGNINNGGIEKDAGVAHSLRAQFSIKF